MLTAFAARFTPNQPASAPVPTAAPEQRPSAVAGPSATTQHSSPPPASPLLRALEQPGVSGTDSDSDSAYGSDGSLSEACFSDDILEDLDLYINDAHAGRLADHVEIACGPGELGHAIRQVERVVMMTLSLQSLASETLRALDVVATGRLDVQLSFDQGYGKDAPMPGVTVRYAATQSLPAVSCSSDHLNPSFSLGVMLIQAAATYLKAHFPPRSNTILLDLFNVLQDRTSAPGDNCMLCAEPLASGCLIPTVCEEPLCIYQLEMLGVGANLKLLHEAPPVADLLISTALAAGQHVNRRPGVMPSHFQHVTGEPMAASDFMATLIALPPLTGGHAPGMEPPADAAEVPVAEMLGRVDAAGQRALRWLFASNQAHITPIAEAQQLAELETPHQFKINTSTRAHAAAFKRNQEQYGSRFAFHGSPFYNWHNILRQNLKNASQTPLMSTGAAYGPGIYLSTSAQTSLTYAAGAPGWACSLFGPNPRCLALCEVANAPTLIETAQTNILVAPLESLVMLRYLFVYCEDAPLKNDVNSNALQLQQYRNTQTLASREPIESVPLSQLVVTTDGYAWDIDELVPWITAKKGLFINGFTQQSFGPNDVATIMAHPRAKEALEALENRNINLRRHISDHTIHHARKVGHILKSDHSIDFAPSMAAIADLKAVLAKTSPEERNALAQAPFEAIDSHTGRPMRETIQHGIELVLDGADCVHKFGDFLTQLSS